MFQHQNVVGDRCANQTFLARALSETPQKLLDRAEIQARVSPLHRPYRIEVVILEPLYELGSERFASSGRAEGAVARVPAGAARDLRHFRRIEMAELIAVEFSVGSECDVIDVEIKAHTDRVGRDEIIDVAGLVEIDLRIPCSWRECTQNHGSAAALAADQFGDGVNLLGRESDDRRAARKPCDFLVAGEAELGKTRALHDIDAGEKPLDQVAYGGGAQDERFLASAAVQQPVGENMPTLEIGGELHLVERKKSDIEILRHRFDSRNPITGVRGLNLSFTCD